MISLFDGTRRRLAVTFNGLTLNNPSDVSDDTYELNTVAGMTVVDAIAELRPEGDGMEVYDARKVSRLVRIEGVIRAPTLARFYDKVKLLAKTFDPALVSLNNPTVNGFLALDFTVLTEDDATYPDGLVLSRYYCRPRTLVEPIDSQYSGTASAFNIELQLRDPRRYLQTTTSLAGTGTAANTRADYPSFPTVTITATGAGSATYSVANTTLGKTLTLNLSGLVNNDVVVVDMEKKSITKNGTATPSLYVSGDYWRLDPGNNTVTVSNPTNVTTATVWRSAFCL